VWCYWICDKFASVRVRWRSVPCVTAPPHRSNDVVPHCACVIGQLLVTAGRPAYLFSLSLTARVQIKFEVSSVCVCVCVCVCVWRRIRTGRYGVRGPAGATFLRNFEIGSGAPAPTYLVATVSLSPGVEWPMRGAVYRMRHGQRTFCSVISISKTSVTRDASCINALMLRRLRTVISFIVYVFRIMQGYYKRNRRFSTLCSVKNF
jgi:hypothetical protein